MIVICKKETKKLVKGLRYEVKNLWNNGQNQSWLEGKIEVKGVYGRYVVDKFCDTNGKSLPKVNNISTTQRSVNLSFSDLKKGDILVCKVDSYKTMVKNGMYKIERLESNTYGRGTHRIWKHTDNYIKFEGINRKLLFNPWRFRKLTPDESREIQLGSILENKDPDIIKSTSIDKFERVLNKEKVLMEALSKSILDPHRHHLSILEWACRKSSGNINLTEDKYKGILDMKLKDILNKIED